MADRISEIFLYKGGTRVSENLNLRRIFFFVIFGGQGVGGGGGD